jgi:hypothetical protein
MYGCILLVGCLGCLWVGKSSWTQYERAPTPDPYMLWQSILGFLGSAAYLAAAAVSFIS